MSLPSYELIPPARPPSLLACVARLLNIRAAMPSVDVRYQSLEAPLNEKAVRALAELQRSYAADRKLQDNIRSASNILAETASAINEAKVERREKHSRHNKRLQENGEDLNDDSEVKAFEARVDDVTEKMDHAIRRIIDDRVWMESISDTLRHVGNKSSNATATQTQRSQRSTQLPTQDATPRQHDLANEDYGNEDVLNSDGNDEEDTTASGPPPPEEAPTTLLRVALSSHKVRHASKTLTERYAHDNDYAGFYKSIHDARHAHLPNPPPVPNAALWFGREEGRLTASLSADGFPEEDTELGVVGERTSVKCPLTLQYFKDPVTSDVCHHSLEKSAILDMLKVSTDFVPFTPEQEIELSRLKDGQRARRERQIRTPRVHCPECNRWMQEADLRANPVLQRRA